MSFYITTGPRPGTTVLKAIRPHGTAYYVAGNLRDAANALNHLKKDAWQPYFDISVMEALNIVRTEVQPIHSTGDGLIVCAIALIVALALEGIGYVAGIPTLFG